MVHSIIVLTLLTQRELQKVQPPRGRRPNFAMKPGKFCVELEFSFNTTLCLELYKIFCDLFLENRRFVLMPIFENLFKCLRCFCERFFFFQKSCTNKLNQILASFFHLFRRMDVCLKCTCIPLYAGAFVCPAVRLSVNNNVVCCSFSTVLCGFSAQFVFE